MAAAGERVLAESVASEAETTAAQAVRVILSRPSGGSLIVYEVLGDAIIAMYSLPTW